MTIAFTWAEAADPSFSLKVRHPLSDGSGSHQRDAVLSRYCLSDAISSLLIVVWVPHVLFRVLISWIGLSELSPLSFSVLTLLAKAAQMASSMRFFASLGDSIDRLGMTRAFCSPLSINTLSPADAFFSCQFISILRLYIP